MTGTYFPHYWPFVQGIYWLPVESDLSPFTVDIVLFAIIFKLYSVVTGSDLMFCYYLMMVNDFFSGFCSHGIFHKRKREKDRLAYVNKGNERCPVDSCHSLALGQSVKDMRWHHTGVIASQITSNSTVVQQLVQGNNTENIKVSHCWPFVSGNHLWQVDSPHKGPVMQKGLPYQWVRTRKT